MHGYGRSDSSGTSLVVAMPGGWTLVLRRADFEADAALARLFGEPVHPRDLGELLPNWASLAWSAPSPSMHYAAESSAADGAYVLYVKPDERGDMDREDVIAAFRRFMEE